MTDFFERGGIISIALTASALLGVLAIAGFVFVPMGEPKAEMRIEPAHSSAKAGDTIAVSVVVESLESVNVFGGTIYFDPSLLTVEKIDYNTSIADLWAIKPWYDNGAGTLNFGGGTTKPDGFTGVGSLITITFRTLKDGGGTLSIGDARILKHDGLGTDAQLKEPIDAILDVSEPTDPDNILIHQTTGTTYSVGASTPPPPPPPSTDLNGDGKQGVADVSILLLHIGGSEARYDFNQDGRVDIKDLSRLLTSH